MFNRWRTKPIRTVGIIIMVMVSALIVASCSTVPGSLESTSTRADRSPSAAESDRTQLDPISPREYEKATEGISPRLRDNLENDLLDDRNGSSAGRSPMGSARSLDGRRDGADAGAAFVDATISWRSGTVDEIEPNASPIPKFVRIPSLAIEARVAAVGIDQNGDMIIPDDGNHVGWYRYGAVPGDPGSAVIAGHLDDYEGRSVFFDLANIEPDSIIEIEMSDGNVDTFRVNEKTAFPADALPSDQVFGRDGESRLALLTCTGDWDHAANRYVETMVVFATPTG